MRPNHSGQTSGKESGNTSRRSSPPIHPSRLALQQTETRSPPSFPSSGGRHHLLSAPRSPAARSPRRDRDRSPPRRVYSPRRSPPRGPAGYRSPPRRGYSPPPTRGPAPQRNGNGVNGPSNHFSTPTGNSHRNDRNDHQKEIPRAPPTGPSRNFSSSAMISPPSGPASTPISMSAHNRLGSQSVLSAPTHPRGTPSSGPPSQRSGNFSGPPPSGPRRGPPPLITRDSPRASPATPTPTASSPGANGSQSASIPTGPRAPPPSARAPHLHPHSSGTFRSGHHNSTSTTYPRTQRFNPHLSALPSIVPGGKLFPPNSSGGDPAISERLSKLQQEQQKIEKELAEKLEKKRKSVRQWERLDRESAREGLKGELAEKQVRMMAGEGGLGGAAF
ncbi:MAG: hypothetical protein M1813_003483 [Trichoglossum hirsutum]|nr:MAG: hypothetical protein M1813_003483 [Trichoglossum hirsutum]